MAEQEGPEHEMLAAKSEEETKGAIEKRKKAKAPLTRAEIRARKAEAELRKAQEALEDSQSRSEQEHQARLKAEQERDEAERALAELRQAMAAEAKPTISPAPPSVGAGAPAQEPSRPAFYLTVSEARVYRIGAPDVMTLTLSPDEAFLVQACFQLQGQEALSLAAQESPYEMKVYAKELTSGRSKLLAKHSAKLAKDVSEYTPKIQVPGLSTGLYRLTTLVTLHARMSPRKGFRYLGIQDVDLADYREVPIIQVAGVQPSVHPAASWAVLSK